MQRISPQAAAALPVRLETAAPFDAHQAEALETALLEAALAHASVAELLDRLRAAALRLGCRRFDVAVLGASLPARVEWATQACFVELARSPAFMTAVEAACGDHPEGLCQQLGTEFAFGRRTPVNEHDFLLLVGGYDLSERAGDWQAARYWLARMVRHFALCLRVEAQGRRRGAEHAEQTRRELDVFTRTISHDLRAPIRRIQGFARLLAEDYAGQLGETGQGYVGRITALCDSMQSMCEGLLAASVSAAGEVRRERVDLGALARRLCADLLATDAARDGKLTVRGEVVAYADAGMMKALMENLVGNAWKFTRTRAFAEIEVGAHFDQGRPVFYVRDNGVGFDMRLRDRLFMPFQRLHSEADYPGTGVGLATVHRIVARHGGRIWAEARPDEGACFHFTLAPGEVGGAGARA